MKTIPFSEAKIDQKFTYRDTKYIKTVQNNGSPRNAIVVKSGVPATIASYALIRVAKIPIDKQVLIDIIKAQANQMDHLFMAIDAWSPRRDLHEARRYSFIIQDLLKEL